MRKKPKWICFLNLKKIHNLKKGNPLLSHRKNEPHEAEEELKASKRKEESREKKGKLTSLLLLLMLAFFFLISSSALLISSKVTPWVERLVCLTLRAWALRCVSLSSSRTGGTNDLKNRNSIRKLNVEECFGLTNVQEKLVSKVLLWGFSFCLLIFVIGFFWFYFYLQ